MLGKVFSKYGYSQNLIHTRFLVVCYLGFAGFFRISELLSIQIKHIDFKLDHMTVLLEGSKTDQLRESEIVYVKRLHRPNCPVAITERYTHVTRLNDNPENYLICRLAKTKQGHRAIGTKSISYTTIRENFMSFISEALQDEKTTSTLGLYSLCSGAASAASERGVSDRLIGKHGRWSSNTSRDRYIKDSKRARLVVTENIGL